MILNRDALYLIQLDDARRATVKCRGLRAYMDAIHIFG